VAPILLIFPRINWRRPGCIGPKMAGKWKTSAWSSWM